MTDFQRENEILRENLDFYMKRVVQLEKENIKLKAALGLQISEARKRFKDRKRSLDRVADDFLDFILDKPGQTTKWYQQNWPEKKYGYVPTRLDNRKYEMMKAGLIRCVVEKDGLQHHYPK